MKKHFITLWIFLLSACAAPPTATAQSPKPTDTPLAIPTRLPFPTRIPPAALAATATTAPSLIADVKFVTEFSKDKADWSILPGSVTAAQLNAEVARQEGDQIRRVNQKVINGFVHVTVTQVGNQVFKTLAPAEITDGKLKEMKFKRVEQVPILASRAVLLEDYFALQFPEVVEQWEAQGAAYEDFKYAAAVTVTWATKYGPLRVSYITSGKYISQEGAYPGRLDYIKECVYESTLEHFLPSGRLALNWYPAPIVELSGTTLEHVPGVMHSDAFGWAPMADFAKAQEATLNEIGDAVSGTPIESQATLEKLQAAFDRAFMPIHCAEALIE